MQVALIEFAHRRRRGLHQLLGALVVGDVQHNKRLGANHIGFGGFHCELERALVPVPKREELAGLARGAKSLGYRDRADRI